MLSSCKDVLSELRLEALDVQHLDSITTLFKRVFTQDPWNDNWDDAHQLHEYMMDTIANRNSRSYGLYTSSAELVGIALGCIYHWCRGTEYYIREFCIEPSQQKKGYGSIFLNLIQQELLKEDIHTIFLSTDTDTSAYSFYKSKNFTCLPKTMSLYTTF